MLQMGLGRRRSEATAPPTADEDTPPTGEDMPPLGRHMRSEMLRLCDANASPSE